MPKVIHFEIPADNPERAVNLYSRVFDWKINTWGGPVEYWLIEAGKEGEPGINGAIMRRTQQQPNVIDTIAVPSYEELVEKIKANGGTILMPKTTVPGVGYMTYFKDPEGNTFGIMQTDLKAGMVEKK